MAALIKEKTGVEATLKRSSGGVFEVSVDQHLIFSKKKEGRFPEDEEILEQLGRSSARP